MIDKFLFAPREPDPNRRYPGESGAQLLARREPEFRRTRPSYRTTSAYLAGWSKIIGMKVGKRSRRQFLHLAAGSVAATQLGMRTSAWAQAASMKFRSLPVEGEIPPLTGATAWINTAPLTPADLRGKVVLVVFWTYTCINWRRSHAFVRAWAQRYSPHGLVVLGVHTPEFPFEHNTGNVQRAVQDMKSPTPSLSTVTTPYGMRSITITGRRFTSSMRKAGSAITNSVKAHTNNRR